MIFLTPADTTEPLIELARARAALARTRGSAVVTVYLELGRRLLEKSFKARKFF